MPTKNSIIQIRALLFDDHRVTGDITHTIPRPDGADAWLLAIGALCGAHETGRPVMLNKHVRELNQFSRTVFFPADFMEAVAFKRMEIEILPAQ